MNTKLKNESNKRKVYYPDSGSRLDRIGILTIETAKLKGFPLHPHALFLTGNLQTFV